MLSDDPIKLLARELGGAMAAQIKDLTSHAVKNRRKDDALAMLLSHIVVETLNRSLGQPTVEGKALRMALITRLANAEAKGPTAAAVPAKEDALLTTAQAAGRLDVSRPYVSMLCDAGMLGDIVLTQGGHRRIRSSAVDAYLATRIRRKKGAPTPRQAGMNGGLYDYPEGHFQNKIREAHCAPSGKPHVARKSAP
jgi:excisionase family DNA binding protein